MRYIGCVKASTGRSHDVVFVAASDKPLSAIQARAFATLNNALLPSKAEVALLMAMSEIYMDRWYWASAGSGLMFSCMKTVSTSSRPGSRIQQERLPSGENSTSKEIYAIASQMRKHG